MANGVQPRKTNTSKKVNPINKDVKEIKAMVLRFKNKGIDNTIYEHKKIIKEKKAVWWGWWSKPYEQIPIEEIKYIRSRLGCINFFLININQGKIYSATCEEIVFSETEPACACPNKDLSPQYYSNYPVKIWFKFNCIEEYDSSLVFSANPKYSFFKHDDLIISVEKASKEYLNHCYDKLASSYEVFAVQEVTLWFLREFKTDDEHVSHGLLTAWLLTKSERTNFPNTYFRANGSKVIILSDLHYDFDNKKHAFPLTDKIGKTTLMKSIDQIFDEKADVCGIIFPGDFTFKALKSEFEYANELISHIKEKFKLKSSQIMIVPGNHDIKFLNNNTGEPLEYKEVEIVGSNSKESYVKFYKDVYGIAPEETSHCLVRRIMTTNHLPIEIIGIDSNILQQDGKNFVGQGFIGNEQLNLVKNQMNLKKEKTYSFRILVLHHHVIPAWYQDSLDPTKPHSVLIDSGALQKFIKEYGINLVIHGHNHDNSVMKLTIPKNNQKDKDEDYSYYVIGIGSAGAEGVTNCVGSLNFETVGQVKYTLQQLCNIPDNTNNSPGRIISEYIFPII